MSKQPGALRLAQDLDAYHMRAEHKQAAAELRRQHALIAELVEALQSVIWAEDSQPDHREDAIRHARAAIAKATGEQQ